MEEPRIPRLPIIIDQGIRPEATPKVAPIAEAKRAAPPKADLPARNGNPLRDLLKLIAILSALAAVLAPLFQGLPGKIENQEVGRTTQTAALCFVISIAGLACSHRRD